MKIDNNTKILGVIGSPIEHSKSPLIHNVGLKKKNLNYKYFAFKVENPKNAIIAMKELNIIGYSVTIPHKIEIMKYIDKIDPLAKKIGAINTVFNKNGKLIGYNTDIYGAINPIKKISKINKKRAYVLGAGGAATAIVAGLKKEGAIVTIFARRLSSAKKLAKKFNSNAKELNEIDTEFDILINATPVGMYPKINDSPIPSGKKIFKKGQIVMDTVYNPTKTKLLINAKKNGARIIFGTEMFLEQAFVQFKIFTGKEAPKKIMRNTFLKEMKK